MNESSMSAMANFDIGFDFDENWDPEITDFDLMSIDEGEIGLGLTPENPNLPPVMAQDCQTTRRHGNPATIYPATN